MLEELLPNYSTVWNFLDSQFLNTLVSSFVAIVLAVVGSRVTNAAKDSAADQGAVSASQQAQQIEADVQEPLVAEAEPQEPDRRQEARVVVEEAKEYLDGKAANASDGRHQRTYGALNRYDYIPLAVALSVRSEIKSWQLAAAVSLFSLWKQFGRGRAAQRRVPQGVLDKLQTLLQELKRES